MVLNAFSKTISVMASKIAIIAMKKILPGVNQRMKNLNVIIRIIYSVKVKVWIII